MSHRTFTDLADEPTPNWKERLYIFISTCAGANRDERLTEQYAQFQFIAHLTFSRDQTAGSNYAREQLLVLGGKAERKPRIEESEETVWNTAWQTFALRILESHDEPPPQYLSDDPPRVDVLVEPPQSPKHSLLEGGKSITLAESRIESLRRKNSPSSCKDDASVDKVASSEEGSYAFDIADTRVLSRPLSKASSSSWEYTSELSSYLSGEFLAQEAPPPVGASFGEGDAGLSPDSTASRVTLEHRPIARKSTTRIPSHLEYYVESVSSSSFSSESDQNTQEIRIGEGLHTPSTRSVLARQYEGRSVGSITGGHNNSKNRNKSTMDTRTYDGLQSQIERLTIENRKLRDLIAAPEQPSASIPSAVDTTYIVLHRAGRGEISLHEPTWRLGEGDQQNLHIDLPLRDADRYMERHPEIAFVIYRDYHTSASPNLSRTQAKDKNAVLDTIEAPTPFKESIRLISDEMVEAMEAFVEQIPHFEHHLPGFRPESEIPAPYLFWYRYRTVGNQVVESLSPRHKELMSLLTAVIEDCYGEEYEGAKEIFERGLVSKRYMKYLVQPDDILVSTEDSFLTGTMCTSWAKWESKSTSMTKDTLSQSRKEAMSLLRYTRRALIKERDESDYAKSQHNGDSEDPVSDNKVIETYRVEGWRWDYNGSFIEKKETVLIKLEHDFSKEKEVKITSLSAYPITYAVDSIKDLLRKRGEMFCSFHEFPLVEYREESWGTISMEIERYIIDYATYRKLHHEKLGSMKNYESGVDPAADPGHILLFPAHVKGFNILRKRWVDLQVDRIRPVVWNKKAFDSLVLDADTKELIQALVMTHLDAENSTDIIAGKGKGLIMLLHGGPGTGKTFTAETVAEIAEKPLYRVTCGDIGTQPENVEKYLESALHLGKIWGCVVLLDEADVFLEERSLSQLDRNALVSVFLRVLEYYEGILLLTSNRVGTFDEAFKSRIQLALHYPNLDMPQRRRIWTNFFNRLKEMNPLALKYDSLVDHIDELSQYNMNGRQIRNVITTGRQLAKYRSRTLDFELLAHVIRISNKFDQYVMEVKKGLSDDEIARGMLNR